VTATGQWSTSPFDDVVATALAEDLGERGDVTSATTVPADLVWRAAVVARAPGVLAGIGAVEATYAALDARVASEALAADGDRVAPGDVLATIRGPARALLTGERTALNLVSHLSGVATLTARYVEAVSALAPRVLVRDTRKTLPGLRRLQKAAVAAGGGSNHRGGLFDGLLVKDNHVAASGGVAQATRRALASAGGLDVQVEVDSLAELDEALAAGARSVLLDNFTIDELAGGVARCRARGPVFVEASGGIDLSTVAEVAATGVDAVAVGALTHSAPALDIGLDFVGE
jgi:nicotinate-nucleotide pyrophosphorylase (carboxylating)